jgi:AraC family transcriptional regulator
MTSSDLSENTNEETKRRCLAGVEVRLAERRPGPGETWIPMPSCGVTVTVRLEQRGGVSEPRLTRDAPTIRSRREAGFFNWIPEQQTIWCYADDVDCVRDLQLRFDRSTVEAIHGNQCPPLDIVEPLLMIYDTRVARCAHALADVFAEGLQDDKLYAESLTIALLVALHSAVSGTPFFTPTGGLAPWQLRIVKEHLAQHLSSGTNLSEVAELVGLSESRIVHGFKASTGLAPYRWVTQARIQKAKALLADNRMSLSEIALEVDFADQSHFTKAFKRGVGITPGEWRRRECP